MKLPTRADLSRAFDTLSDGVRNVRDEAVSVLDRLRRSDAERMRAIRRQIQRAGGAVVRGDGGDLQFLTTNEELFREGVERDKHTGRAVRRQVRVGASSGGMSPIDVLPRSSHASRAAMRASREPTFDWAEAVDSEELASYQGKIGTYISGGQVYAEHREDLRPYEARGFTTDTGVFRKMYRGNDVCSDGIDTLVNILASASIECAPVPLTQAALETLEAASRQAAGGTPFDAPAHQRHCDYVNAQIYANPNVRLGQYRREQIWGKLVDGLAIHEYIIDVEAPIKLQGIEYREPATIQDWLFRPGEEVPIGFAQNTSASPTPEDTMAAVDLRRCVHVVNRGIGNNPEGISQLRGAWLAHKAAMVFLKTGIFHRQRFGVGFPIFRTKDGVPQTEKDMEAKARARKFFASPTAYMDLPAHVDLEILQLQGDASGLEMLRYLDQKMRRATGTQWADQGMSGQGSWALQDVNTQMFLKQLNAHIEDIADAEQTLIRALVDARFGPQPIYPRTTARGVFARSAQDVLAAWEGVARIEMSGTYDDDAVNTLRDELDIPRNTTDVEPSDDDGGEGGPDGGLDDGEGLPEGEGGETERERAHEHRGCCGTSRKAGPNRITVEGRDGGTLKFYRHLTDCEQHVAWRTLEGLLESAEGSARRDVQSVGRQHRAAFIDEADPLIDARDLEGLAKLSVSYAEEYQRAIEDELREVAINTRLDIIDELSAASGVPTSEIEPHIPTAGDIQGEIIGQAAITATAIDTAFQQRLRQAARNVANGGRRGEMTSLVPQDRSVELQVREAVTSVMVDMRGAAMGAFAPGSPGALATTGPDGQPGVEIPRVQYSAVMDGDTCGQIGDGTKRCADMDARVMTRESALFRSVRPPNPYCDGAKALSRANPCRCIAVPILTGSVVERMVRRAMREGRDVEGLRVARLAE